ncbi:MAG: alpha-glucan family phosphorylase, partial [Planctomycetes bacterium]|nr:alpha-glucan family phosphorylase [Planctomycetota bacterium]
DVAVRAWEYRLAGILGDVPVLLLDTDVDGNAAEDRRLTRRLYDVDGRGRLAQEAVLGIGGVRILRALGHTSIARYHMNEGHAALLALELLAHAQGGAHGARDFEALRKSCVFTTHTPVPAGHDRFDYASVAGLLGETVDLDVLRMLGGPDELSMTLLGLNVSGYVNGVAKRHGEVSRGMFPDHVIHAITNGIHPATWAAPAFARLFDRHVPEWRADAFALRSAFRIPRDDLRAAHAEAKRGLLDRVERTTGVRLDPAALTIGFARRATPYKRADLVLRDPDRLRAIAKARGPLQLVFAGKAHPRDEGGKQLIQKILRLGARLRGSVPVVYLPEHDMDLARCLVAGVDLWLNTPRKPLEASGTSGMKAALNGVPSLSVLDGWWLEGHIEGVTGWSIGSREPVEGDDAQEAEELYKKLEHEILPRFRGPPDSWADVMRSAIALNGSYFNTQRMVQQYIAEAYAPVSAL